MGLSLMNRWAFVVMLLTFGVGVGVVGADDGLELTPEQQRRAVGLYDELKCPVCKSQSVASSTSFLSEEMKKQIREFIASGKTDREIVDYYVTRYGDWILMRPKTEGSGLFAWLVPVFLLLGVAGWLTVMLRRWSRRSDDVDGAPNSGQSGEIDEESDRKIRSLVEGQ